MIADEEMADGAGGAAAAVDSDAEDAAEPPLDAPGAPDAEGSSAASSATGRGRKKRRYKGDGASSSGGEQLVRAPSRAQTKRVHSCIVKLIVQRVDPNYAEPWRTRSQSSSSGTGFLISNRRIITNAHVVRNCTHVRARKSLSPVMFSCTVEWISIPLDLAVLSVNDEDAFFGTGTGAAAPSVGAAADAGTGADATAANGGTAEMTESNGNGTDAAAANADNATAESAENGGTTSSPAEVGLPLCPILPRLDENVTCVGFPRGGQQISVTRGVVSRVDVNSHGVLRIQIDAAINPGNSGGPVFDELGRVIGIASSHLRGGSNIGYIIPTEVLSHFLEMTEDGLEASPLERSALNAETKAVTKTEEGDKDEEMKDADDNAKEANGGEKVGVVGVVGPKMVPGIAGLGANTQTLESKALRKRLGLKDQGDGGGVRVSGVWSPLPLIDSNTPIEDSGDGIDKEGLLVDDVLLSIDGIEVGQDGTIPLSKDRPYERIGKSYLITRHRVGKTVELGIIRGGKPMTLKVALRPNRYLCPVYDTFDAHSSYVVCGGCVFVPMSWPWISAHRKKGGFPSYNAISSDPAKGDEQILVLSKVLADEVNVGYHHKQFLILRSVNGEKPSNMRDLIRLIIKGGNETNLEFRCYMVNQEYCEQLVCLDVDEVKKAEERILKQHMVAQWCSEDVIPPEMKNQRADANTMVELLEKATNLDKK